MMKKIALLALALTMIVPVSGEKQDKNKQQTRTQWVEMPKSREGMQEQMLYRKGYTASYNPERKTPNWVAWRLTKGHTYGRVQRSQMEFSEDPESPTPRVNTFDYMSSGYDRGHMCPAGDNKWDKEAMRQTFLMTNISPQRHNFNVGSWNDLELKCRDWARAYDEIYIVCGPIYYKGQQHKRIGKRKVWVPEAYFKVVLRLGSNPAALGFIYANDGKNQPMSQTVRSVDEIEKITGMDFFHNVKDEIEDRVEASARLKDWK